MPRLLDIKSQRIYPDISAFRILLLLHELRVEGGACQELLLLWICAQTRLLRLNRARHRLYRNAKRINSLSRRFALVWFGLLTIGCCGGVNTQIQGMPKK